jgi:hypothetical protein
MNIKKTAAVFATSVVSLSIIGGLIAGSTPTNTTDAAASPVTPQDNWQLKIDYFGMNGSKTVALPLAAENTIQGPVAFRKPSLIIRCHENKTDLYVATGMAAAVETDFEGDLSGDHTVRIHLDNGNPLTEKLDGIGRPYRTFQR